MRKRTPPPVSVPKPNAFERLFPRVLVTVVALIALTSLRTPPNPSLFDVNGFAKLPVLNGGRMKPMDSVARSALLMIHGKQTVRIRGENAPAIVWLMDVLFDAPKADTVPLFRIDDPDVLGLMNMQQTQERDYSFGALRPYLTEIERQATQANELKAEHRSRYQTAVVNLASRLLLYHKLQNTLQVMGMTDVSIIYQQSHDRMTKAAREHLDNPGAKMTASLKELKEYMDLYGFLEQAAEFYPLPNPSNPADPTQWVSIGRGLILSLGKPDVIPGLLAYATLADAYRTGDAPIFNQTVQNYRLWISENTPAVSKHINREFLFNNAAPFSKAMAIYLVVFLLAVLSWLIWPRVLSRAAFFLLVLAFVIHTIGLVSRMALQGRPPVTNLYSSAIFVGWVSVLLGLALERLSRRGIGSVVASTVGFITLIIAHHLAAQGDTLEMMRAVLDSNFWLATHVVCITIGYSSTFVSGTLAIVYILRRRFDRGWDAEKADHLDAMVYGVVCFSAFFSFLGTILGGIWADQSWGRFWGWDPKENGALMIVLWNAFVLHARWGRVASQRTLVTLSVTGNIVTALSWFGVNMLGIGLHSYGFMDKAFVWLVAFIVLQLALVSLAFVPVKQRQSSL